MAGYVDNNYILVSKYSKLYDNDIEVEDWIENIINSNFELLNVNPIDLYCFRVFLDNCLMLFNKEKLQVYLARNYEYKGFFENDDLKSKFTNYLTRIKLDLNEARMTSYANQCEFKHLILLENEGRLWDEISIFRNAIAHMQYGSFIQDNELGIIYFYEIFNKDKGILKNRGIALEPIIHEFVSRYFSNQSVLGIPYKHTFIYYKDNEPNFVTVSFDNKDNLYKTQYNHPMQEYFKHQTSLEEIKKYIDSVEGLNIVEEKLISDWKEIDTFVIRERNKSEYTAYTAKFLYDIETEFSNFLVHLRQLNDRIIDLIHMIKESKKINENEKIFDSIRELKEDKESVIVFRYLFIILKLYNFILRLEDDDRSQIELRKIDISNFTYDTNKIVNYINEKWQKMKISDSNMKYADKQYILERLRNAIIHGHIKCFIQENELYINLNDRYQHREEIISISLKNLDKFLRESRNL